MIIEGNKQIRKYLKDKYGFVVNNNNEYFTFDDLGDLIKKPEIGILSRNGNIIETIIVVEP